MRNESPRDYRRTLNTTLHPSDGMQSHQTSCSALLNTNLFPFAQAHLTENTMALPETVGFIAKQSTKEIGVLAMS